MNLDKATIQPVNLWTCFLVVRSSGIPSIALIWSRLTSIPRCDTKKPKNFPEAMPNAHFSGFSFIMYRLSMSKA